MFKYFFSLAVIIFGLVAMGAGCSTSNKNPVISPDSNIASPVEAGSPQAKLMPVQKTFNSSKLGINFTYDEQEAHGSGKIKVTEVGNKVYVHLDGYDYAMGQSIEVFSKDPKLTLEEAIKNKFLQGYSSKDCWAKTLAPNDYPRPDSQNLMSSNFVFAVIAFPDKTNDSDPWWENGSKCPAEYSLTNAANFFVMDENFPGKYFFVKLGQEMIASDGGVVDSANGLRSWFSSFNFKPVYSANAFTSSSNSFDFKELGFSIKLPIAPSNLELKFVEAKPDLVYASNDMTPKGAYYRAVLHQGTSGHIVVSSFSTDWEDAGRDAQITDISDFEVDIDRNIYKIIMPYGLKLDIRPIKIRYVGNVPIIIFDSGKDFYEKHMADYGITSWSQEYSAVFKLPNSKKFKAAIITFQESELPLDKFIEALETIEFK